MRPGKPMSTAILPLTRPNTMIFVCRCKDFDRLQLIYDCPNDSHEGLCLFQLIFVFLLMTHEQALSIGDNCYYISARSRCHSSRVSAVRIQHCDVVVPQGRRRTVEVRISCQYAKRILQLSHESRKHCGFVRSSNETPIRPVLVLVPYGTTTCTRIVRQHKLVAS